ncbi:flagellar basal body-associated FliL family protein [Nocardioides sp. SOB77]|uniref:Flagellar protein FliL n=1 Tax=Nocardioides oceani TaxID=3058369 RepID=A0ABT8FGI8_9ACTN|nr:flagellar basal body-associated FliL family protein [Nocardioides oceani]MDN4173550.1 flagellar basal body-associated FliL family protein [Nocardioides oceani]
MSTTTLSAPAPAAAEEEPAGGGRKKLVLLLVLVLVAGAAAYWFLLRPGSDAEPVPGEVLVMEPVQVNLADGHYLSVGIALQLVEGAAHADGSKALDATIDLFSGREPDELVRARNRNALKEELMEELDHRYHGEVLDVYFTQFVTQ